MVSVPGVIRRQPSHLRQCTKEIPTNGELRPWSTTIPFNTSLAMQKQEVIDMGNTLGHDLSASNSVNEAQSGQTAPGHIAELERCRCNPNQARAPQRTIGEP